MKIIRKIFDLKISLLTESLHALKIKTVIANGNYYKSEEVWAPSGYFGLKAHYCLLLWSQ